MSDTDRVIKYLQSKSARGGCDACLARETGSRTRAQVAQACRRLAADGTLVRKKGKCPLGGHTRVLNVLAPRTASKRSRRPKTDPTARRAVSRGRTRVPASPTSTALEIEDAWRYVDRFCRSLWLKHLESEPPVSLAESITSLRDRELLPAHQANMMHTIRALRNFVVHENLDFGDHETTIARAAWDIVRAWAEKREREPWRKTLQLCAWER